MVLHDSWAAGKQSRTGTRQREKRISRLHRAAHAFIADPPASRGGGVSEPSGLRSEGALLAPPVMGSLSLPTAVRIDTRG